MIAPLRIYLTIEMEMEMYMLQGIVIIGKHPKENAGDMKMECERIRLWVIKLK